MDKIRFYLRQKLIRLRHWEYWPFNVVYLPIYFYWCWLMLKARSFFFFNTANPLITNGGFLMESKKEIYDLIPEGLYPKTVLLKAGAKLSEVMDKLQASGLAFPLVGKPDIGMRGLQVSVLKDTEDLQRYAQKSKVDFLLQEYIAYENEVGIFYYRLPGSNEGTISGIVGKEFLSVVGDGQRSLAELLLRNSRAVLQWKALQTLYGLGLHRVPAKGELVTVVPYGNHSRGAKFVDLTHLADAVFIRTIDTLCQTIPQFYYGRLDVRFRSWEELRQGTAFSIIELNGAGSEPTHIYDPKHSLFFAWKEIIRHLDLLYQISKTNKARLGIAYMPFSAGLKMLKANSRHLALMASGEEN
jgi:hypothetical protein